MASNNVLRAQIRNLQKQLGPTVTQAEFRKFLTNNQRRVYNANKSVGTKRVLRNTAATIPVLPDTEKATLRTLLFKEVKDGKTTDEFIEELDSQAKKLYIRELLSNVSGIQGYCPLVNLGNTCFMNAAMQLLHSIPELKVFFGEAIPNWQTKEVVSCHDQKIEDLRLLLRAINVFFIAMNRNSILGIPLSIDKIRGGSGGVIYDEIIKILQLQEHGLTKEEKKAILQEFGNNLSEEEKKEAIKLLGKRQEDAGEFINKLFSKLFCFPFLQPISQLFEVVLISTITCQEPSLKPVKKVTERVLALPILDPKVVDTQSALDVYQASEIFTEDNNQIDGCSPTGVGTGTAISKQLKLHTENTTKYIILTFTRNLTEYHKLDKVVNASPSIRVGNNFFKLKMCVTHLGKNANVGHYIAYGFDDTGAPNALFNDSSIRPLSGDKKEHITNIQTGGLAFLYEKTDAPAAVVAPNQVATAPKKGGRKTRKQRRSKKRHSRKH